MAYRLKSVDLGSPRIVRIPAYEITAVEGNYVELALTSLDDAQSHMRFMGSGSPYESLVGFLPDGRLSFELDDSTGTALSTDRPTTPEEFIVRVEYSDSRWRVYINDVQHLSYVSTASFTVNTLLNFDDSGTSGVTFVGYMAYCEFGDANGVTRYYDPTASNGTGSDLIDTISASNGTLEGFPTDGTQWESYNSKPKAVIQNVDTVPAGVEISTFVDTTGSEGAIVSYAWTGTGGITFSDPTIANPTFITPSASEDATYQISCTVTDEFGGQTTTTADVLVEAENEFVNRLDLRKPEGSVLPTEITITEGDFKFNGEGLARNDTVTSRFEYNPKTSQKVYMRFDMPSTVGSPQGGSRFFYSDTYEVNVYYNQNQRRLTIDEKQNGVRTNRVDIAREAGDAAKVQIAQLLVGQQLWVYLDEQLVSKFDLIQMPEVTTASLWIADDTVTLTDLVFTDEGRAAPALPSPDMLLPLEGEKLVATKLGKMFDKPSTMTASEEFWIDVVDTSVFENWPHERYPKLARTSTDHDSVGGIYIRVYDSNVGPITNKNAWFEWDEISSRAEFSHITQKTNPVFVYDEYGASTETPSQLVLDNGEILIYFHNNQVSLPDLPTNMQVTFYGKTTNGIDIFDIQPSTLIYDATLLEGNGHCGYFRPGINTITEIPHKYIGVYLHGGNGTQYGIHWAIAVSDDGINWTRYKMLAQSRGRETEFINEGQLPETDYMISLRDVFNAKKVGAYYRVTGQYQLPSAGGLLGERVACELLVDSDFNFVSVPNIYVGLGATGEFDELEVLNVNRFEYEGQTYAFYKTTQTDELSAIGMVSIEEAPYTWQIFNGMADKTALLSAGNLAEVQSAFTSNKTLTTKTESGYDYVTLPVLADNSESTLVSNQTISVDNEVTDIVFENIGRDTLQNHDIEFGITDAIESPTNALSIFVDGNEVQFPKTFKLKRKGTIYTTTEDTVKQFGTDNGQANLFESATAKHNLTLRLIKHRNVVEVLCGGGVLNTFDIFGFDYSKPMNVFLKSEMVDTGESTDSSVSLKAVSVQSALASQLSNAPPTANAGVNQSVIAGATFTLDGSASTDTDGTIVEYRWSQPAGDTVALDLTDPLRPVGVAPSTSTAQTLTFSLITVDDQGAESDPSTTDVAVAAMNVNNILTKLDTRSWELTHDGSVQAFKGRSNREPFKFKVFPSDDIPEFVDENGYFVFDSPGINRVEVITAAGSSVSSSDDGNMIRGNVIAARTGDLTGNDPNNLELTFVLYVDGDDDGLVMTASELVPYQKAAYFRR